VNAHSAVHAPRKLSWARRRSGFRALLVHALLAVAEAAGERLVALLGAPAYYGRLGFVPAADLGVVSPDPAWGAHFQARALADPPPRGVFRYAAPFDRL
jgi:putative acetyltransferase